MMMIEYIKERWRGILAFALGMFLFGAFFAWAIQWVPLEYSDGEYRDWRTTQKWVDF